MYVSHRRPQFTSSSSDRTSQSMVAYLWLVWYQANSKASPKHWALAVTYELHERAYATFYEVCFTYHNVISRTIVFFHPCG